MNSTLPISSAKASVLRRSPSASRMMVSGLLSGLFTRFSLPLGGDDANSLATLDLCSIFRRQTLHARAHSVGGRRIGQHRASAIGSAALKSEVDRMKAQFCEIVARK